MTSAKKLAPYAKRLESACSLAWSLLDAGGEWPDVQWKVTSKYKVLAEDLELSMVPDTRMH